jgi:hypothetical protein
MHVYLLKLHLYVNESYIVCGVEEICITAKEVSFLKYVKLLIVETWWMKACIGISGGGSSRRPRSIKDCRARGRRRSKGG